MGVKERERVVKRQEESGEKRGRKRMVKRENIVEREGEKERGRGSHCATEPSNKNVKK